MTKKNYLVIVLVIIVAVYNFFPSRRAPAVKLKGYIYINLLCVCVCVYMCFAGFSLEEVTLLYNPLLTFLQPAPILLGEAVILNVRQCDS